jgi:hypothetical protein
MLLKRGNVVLAPIPKTGENTGPDEVFFGRYVGDDDDVGDFAEVSFEPSETQVIQQKGRVSFS